MSGSRKEIQPCLPTDLIEDPLLSDVFVLHQGQLTPKVLVISGVGQGERGEREKRWDKGREGRGEEVG